VNLDTYLDELASAAPTPGGGSAATIVAALGAALVAMVARITRDGAAYAAVRPLADELAHDAERARSAALAARERDEAAYGAVVAAKTLPKDDAAQKAARATAIQHALAGAAEAPLETAALAQRVAQLAERALALENPYLTSDLACAAEFAASALAAAAWNVRVNHAYMKDAAAVARQETALARYERETERLAMRVRSEAARARGR